MPEQPIPTTGHEDVTEAPKPLTEVDLQACEAFARHVAAKGEEGNLAVEAFWLPLIPEVRRLRTELEISEQTRKAHHVVMDNMSAEIVTLRTEIARLRAALRKYAIHSNRCLAEWSGFVDDPRCTCGLRKAVLGEESD